MWTCEHDSDICFILVDFLVLLLMGAYCACTHNSEHVVIPSDLRVTDIWCVLRHKSLLSGESMPMSVWYSMRTSRGAQAPHRSGLLSTLIVISSPWFFIVALSGKYIHNTYSPIIVYGSVGREAGCGIRLLGISKGWSKYSIKGTKFKLNHTSDDSYMPMNTVFTVKRSVYIIYST